MRILVVNPGSSSFKVSVLSGASNDANWTVTAEKELPVAVHSSFSELTAGLENIADIDAAGVRVVHGGDVFCNPVSVTDDVITAIDEFSSLAPLHNPLAVAVIRTLRKQYPTLPVVVCFDTAFHTTLSPKAYTYPIPHQWTEKWKLRRYGFHGLSHAYASRRAAELVQQPLQQVRLVTCHLGAGASLAAVQGGVSVDTTMGFTPMEGLMMATRAGSVDPGLTMWVLQHTGLSAADVEQALDQKSGLFGVTGDSDMKNVLTRAGEDDQRAQLAIGIYVHRLRAGIAAMCAAMNGVDGIVFTGGVGEHSPLIRQLTCEGLAFLGVDINHNNNAQHDKGDAIISMGSTAVFVGVIHAGEDVEIARQTALLVKT